MAIRFRFRSSLNFDSVDIGEGRASISIGELKSRIVHNKKLNICQDFDLLFSDALTGQEYYDETFQLPSGSSVIIKRVPKGTARPDLLCGGECFDDLRTKDLNVVKSSVPASIEVDKFDDFGAELCPILGATASDSDLVADKKLYFANDETTTEAPRCFEMPLVRCQKPEASDLSEAIPQGTLHIDVSEDISHKKLKPDIGEFREFEMVVTTNPLDRGNADLPVDLRCSLCDMYFKDAVMIPCCQHSFCEKCIRLALIEKGRCPKCLSTKNKVEDLLPNVSLRQAIKHFLESQIQLRSSDNAFGYAPDGESGIQVKEMSCAMSIQQREIQLPHSPCTTGKGSNQIIGKTFGGKSFLSPKLRQMDGEKHDSNHPVDLEGQTEDSVADFQGENQLMHEEAESTIKKKRALHVHTAGAERSYMEMGRYRKGDRTCYMCGSPDHFVRDCPAALNPHPIVQTGNATFPRAVTGYLSPYWNGAAFPQIRPFVNPYGDHFNATLVPPAPYAVPTYMPSMYGGMAPYGAFTRMAGAASMVRTSAEWHLGQFDCRDRQGYEKRQKLSHDNLTSDEEDGSYNKWRHPTEAKRSHEYRSYRDREDSTVHSKDSFNERSHRKHQSSDHFDDELERSSSEVEDMPSSSSWHSKERHKHHRRSSKRHDGGKEWGGGNSSHGHHQSTKSKHAKQDKVGSDTKRDQRKHSSQSVSGLERSLSNDQKTHCKERDSSHGSRHSRHNSRSTHNNPSYERWQMVSGSDGDVEDDYHYHKRKKGLS